MGPLRVHRRYDSLDLQVRRVLGDAELRALLRPATTSAARFPWRDRNAAGAALRSRNVINGDGGVREYTLALKYENLDDELEGGINFIKRLGGAAQDQFGYLGVQQTPVSFNFNIWDIYAKKRLGKFNLGAEIPITTGNIGTAEGAGHELFDGRRRGRSGLEDQ